MGTPDKSDDANAKTPLEIVGRGSTPADARSDLELKIKSFPLQESLKGTSVDSWTIQSCYQCADKKKTTTGVGSTPEIAYEQALTTMKNSVGVLISRDYVVSRKYDVGVVGGEQQPVPAGGAGECFGYRALTDLF